MNRIEFMTELASLLQDIPVEERKDAMQYYNDYFDDAGEEQEQQVIEELESPAKVAEKIKADMAGFREEDKAQYAGHQGADPAAGRTKAKPDRTAELPADASSGAAVTAEVRPDAEDYSDHCAHSSGASDSSSAGSRPSVSGAGDCDQPVRCLSGPGDCRRCRGDHRSCAIYLRTPLPGAGSGGRICADGDRADPDRSGSSCVSGSGKTLCSSDSWHLPGNCVDLS